MIFFCHVMFSEVLKASDRRLTAEGDSLAWTDRRDLSKISGQKEVHVCIRTLWCWFHPVISLSAVVFSVFRCMRSAVLHWFDFPALLFCSAWLNQNDSVSEPRENLSLSFLLSLTLTLYTVRDKLTVAPFLMSCFHREPCHTHFSVYKPRSCSFPTVPSLPLNLT